MANNKKKKIVNDSTTIGSEFLQPIFGGDTKAPINSPEFNGHFHDGRADAWGHAPKIDLTEHTNGRLTLADESAVAKSVVSYPPFNVTSENFTIPTILSSAIWYFPIPLDMDVTKPSYFTFEWMGDIITVDMSNNNILDPSKLTVDGVPASQTTTFRVTWQWYTSGYSIYPPSVIYDGYTPTNIVGSNTNQNTLTRGRISSLAVNSLPFKLMVNDSSINAPNYINLTGLQYTNNAIMIGIQVDVLSCGFITPAAPVTPPSGANRFIVNPGDGFDILVTLPFQYTPGTNQIQVFVEELGDTVYSLVSPSDYVETSPSSIVINSVADPGDSYLFLSSAAAALPSAPQRGHLMFFQGNFIYLSKTMGSSNISFKAF